MRLANVDGRAVLLAANTTAPGQLDGPHDLVGVDVESASGGRWGPELPAIYDDWNAFRAWSSSFEGDAGSVMLDRSRLESPSPAPRQIVAVGLNYRAHAAESGFGVPDQLPPTFTKFPSALTGPDCEVVLPAGGHTDWEVELVVVIGQRAKDVDEASAWDHVAGLAVGQDLSERVSQMAGPAPQFSLGKSFPRFAPVGPWLVTPDELADKDDLALGCSIDGETMQQGRTGDLIFSVPSLIAKLSGIITLFPGDLIFTGTPAGVGMGRTPARFLQPGERLDSWIEGIGRLRQVFVAAKEA